MEKHKHDDDLFKKILETHPEFEPNPADVEDMRRRLDEAEQPRQNRGVGWWLPFLLVPILLGTIGLFLQNRNLNTQINQLKTQLIDVKNDTLEHKFITYHFDTIYNTIYKEKIIQRQVNRSPFDDYTSQNTNVQNYFNDDFRTLVFSSPVDYFGKRKNPFNYLPSYGKKNNNTSTIFQKYIFSKNNDQINTVNNDLVKENFVSKEGVFIPSLLSFLEKKKVENLILDLEQHTLDFKKWRRSPVHFLTPKNFRIGIEGSPYGFVDYAGSQAFKPMYSYGIGSEIGFGEQFRMAIGLRKLDIKFETKDPVEMAKYPAVMANDPTDIIREMYVTINHLQIPISFKYLLSKNKKWLPFFSAGIVASRPIEQSFQYKFINTSLQEYELNQKFSDGNFSIKNVEATFGLEYNISKRWVGSGQFFYRHDLELNTGEYFILRNVGLNLGLKYKL